MRKKSKSHSEAFLDDFRAKKKNNAPKKIIHCRCWPGIYEAVCRLSNGFSHDKLEDENLSISEFINILIGACHLHVFGEYPNSDNNYSNNSKGDNLS